MRLARYVEITLIKFIYHVLDVSKLIDIYIILNIISIDILLFTARKGVIYLVGYPIPYRPIPFHGTISRELTSDLL